ncbi:olfactory receptor 14A16-like [Hemicordylus capensis]|uniref:olfactory receptor 14A16-like n=1 Tax=Hemicordylus capensis TaxID=884348 RepID=UPI0023020F9F|nr:olfactory receptor 14A16-like [Hemicordylus capensis]
MVTEFLLLGFTDSIELQMLHFILFLLIYLIAMIGNLLLILVVAVDSRLHTPMYFFLANLSILDICYISVTIPKSIDVSFTGIRSISFFGCMAQIFLGITFGSVEMALLTVMAYDRYIAICYPLHYHIIMNKVKCSSMAAGCWVISIIYSALHTLNIIILPFCGPNDINQLFCDIPQVLKLACSDTFGHERAILVCGIVLGAIICSSISASYVHIFSTILKIPSSQGKHKAFSTCFPHLMVFFLFIITGMFTYMKKGSEVLFFNEILAALLYSIVPPIANPIIYSLRNKEIKKALRHLMNKVLSIKEVTSEKSKGNE